jgi:hypothetical protein
MIMFAGFVQLGSIIELFSELTVNGVPAIPDAAPQYRIYGQTGVVANGTGTLQETGAITNVSNATPAVITSTGNTVTTGTVVSISGVNGATGVNGSFIATNINATQFSVPVSAGGAYTGGGIWQTVGLYSITVNTASGYEAGVTYTVVVTWAVSGVFHVLTITFTVC